MVMPSTITILFFALTLALTLTLNLGFLTSREMNINTDLNALLALKQSLIDPDNVLGSWAPELVDACTFFHITCNDQKRVVRVDLQRYNLSGKLVSELGDLDQLQYLELYGNNLEGSIPAELGKLQSLKSLDLDENNLSGDLPSSLGNLRPSLLFLRVNDNKQLTGTVPKALVGIQVLNITNTGITMPPA